MQKCAKNQSVKLTIALSMSFVAIGIGIAVATKPILGVVGLISALGFVLLMQIIRWLLKEPVRLYGILLSANLVAHALMTEGDNLLRIGFRAMGFGVAFVIILITLWKVLRRPGILNLVYADVFLVSLLAWQLLAVIETVNLRDTLSAAFGNTLTVLTCVYGLRVLLQDQPRSGVVFLGIWHSIGFLFAVIGLILLMTGPINIGPFYFGDYALKGGIPRVSSIFEKSNKLGNFLYVAVIATYGLWRRSSSRKKRLYLLFSGIVTGGVLVLTLQRSAYLGLTVGGLIVFWKNSPLYLKIIVIVTIVIGASTAYSFMKSDDDLVEAFKLEQVLSNRDEIWKSTIVLIQESPVAGKGNVLIEVPPKEGRVHEREPITTHNAYLNIALRAGYIGLGLFIFAYVMMLVLACWGQRLQTDFDTWATWTGLAIVIAVSVQQLFTSRVFYGLIYSHMTFWIALTLGMMPLFRYRLAERFDSDSLSKGGMAEVERDSVHCF